MVTHGVAGAMKTTVIQCGLFMEIKTQTLRSEHGHSTKKTQPDFDGLAVVADYDYSDAPDWALPREWFIYEQYQLEYEPI
jgi:hypothetical protein